jgi:hypothetical protein
MHRLADPVACDLPIEGAAHGFDIVLVAPSVKLHIM